MDDPRFAKFSSDPKFRPVPRRERKIKIDPRFKSMFNDKSFVDKVSVDKRGRPKNFATKENFEKFYDLESSSEDESDEEDEEQIEEKKPQKKLSKAEKEKIIKSKLRSDEVDYSRGEGVIDSDSSSDDSSSDSSDEEGADAAENKFEKWGELDHDAERTDESTNRIAVCNMDWDRVGAKDIFIALTSFCPPGGTVSSVKVYISDFGKKRLEEEETLGPQELRQSTSRPEIDFDNLDDDGEIDADTMEKIRVYQVNRLKYYYAVAEFDSVETADKVYQECDGMEYELSASKFDLRFIPDDMSFEDEPKEVCNQLPDPSTYKPKFFTTTALKQGKVNLTWDEPDQDRIAALRKAFNSEDCDDDDIKAYLANSSESEEDDGRDNILACDDEVGEVNHESEEAVVAKYKSLLNDLQQKVKKSEDDSKDMEFSWVPNDTPNEQSKAEEVEAMTPWEQYLHKKKLKRKEKRERKKNSLESKNEDEGEQQLFSDDELPDGVDLDDPFFKVADSKEKEVRTKKNKKKNKDFPKETSQNNDGLDLLCMESDDDKEHFDYKNIVKTEKKKKKKKLKKNTAVKEDNFKIDVSDERFSAVFDKADYNVDPSNPNFKKTKAMQALIEEKQRRRHGKKDGIFSEDDKSRGEPSNKKLKVSSSSLETLVQSVKSKSKDVKKRSNKF